MIRNTSSSWGSISRWLHWGLGLTIIALIAYGWWMNHIPARADRFFHRSIHSNIGYAVLVLMALRLIWRAINPVPARRRTRRGGSEYLQRSITGASMRLPSW